MLTRLTEALGSADGKYITDREIFFLPQNSLGYAVAPANMCSTEPKLSQLAVQMISGLLWKCLLSAGSA